MGKLVGGRGARTTIMQVSFVREGKGMNLEGTYGDGIEIEYVCMPLIVGCR